MGRIADADVEEVGLGVVEEGREGVDVMCDEEAVSVEVTEVTAVNVEVDTMAFVSEVDGEAGGGTGVVGEGGGTGVVEEGGGELDGGDAVTIGCTVVTAVELSTQPTLAHEYPGTQHPPPALSGQLVSPAGQPATFPPQVWPSAQHPTSPEPESAMIWQPDPVGQQLLGLLMEVQAVVSPGHEKARGSRGEMSRGDLRKRPESGWALRCWLLWRAKAACNG